MQYTHVPARGPGLREYKAPVGVVASELKCILSTLSPRCLGVSCRGCAEEGECDAEGTAPPNRAFHSSHPRVAPQFALVLRMRAPSSCTSSAYKGAHPAFIVPVRSGSSAKAAACPHRARALPVGQELSCRRQAFPWLRHNALHHVTSRSLKSKSVKVCTLTGLTKKRHRLLILPSLPLLSCSRKLPLASRHIPSSHQPLPSHFHNIPSHSARLPSITTSSIPQDERTPEPCYTCGYNNCLF